MKEKHIHKSVNFKPNDTSDMELYNKLKRLEHGEFSKRSKELWEIELKEREGK